MVTTLDPALFDKLKEAGHIGDEFYFTAADGILQVEPQRFPVHPDLKLPQVPEGIEVLHFCVLMMSTGEPVPGHAYRAWDGDEADFAEANRRARDMAAAMVQKYIDAAA